VTGVPDGCGTPPPGVSGRRSLRSLACAEFDRILAGRRLARAVDHPLDFVCIPIVRTPRAGVCGHIWSNTSAASTIHAHSWHLYSEVVLGAITNEVFQVSEQQDGDYQVLQVRTAGLTDRITSTSSTIRVSGTSTELCRDGSSYTLSASTFHRSTPIAAGLTLTLVKATMLAGHVDQILVRRPRSVETSRRQLLPDDMALPLVSLFRRVLEFEGSESESVSANLSHR
jgi:hypothetical protein